MDPDAYRADSHERWSRSAPGWGARRAEVQRSAQAVSLRMIELLAPHPGQTILELAAGPADTGLLAAELVAPGGGVILSDFAEPMVDVARKRAVEVGARNVEFRVIDGESIELPAGSVDGVLCRWGYMLMADPATALQETRRVLRPGGRVALAAWDGPDLNRWASVPFFELVSRGLVPGPVPGGPGMFAFAAPGRIEELLGGAGFGEITVEPVDVAQRFDSFEHYWLLTRDLNRPLDDVVSKLDEAEVEDVRAALLRAFEGDIAPGGALTIPGRALVASATA